MRTLIALLSLIFLPACEVLRSTRVSEPETVSLTASRWDVRYSINMPAHPTQNGAGWKVKIPQDTGLIAYVLHPHTTALSGKIECKLGIEAGADVWFDHKTETANIGDLPAAASLVIYADNETEFGRWWSNPARWELTPGGSGKLSVSLDPRNWSSVLGKFGDENAETKKAFANILANPVSVGLTFGGGYFKGHGVIPRNGSATLKVSQFSVR